MNRPAPNDPWHFRQSEDESWTVPIDPSADAMSGSADFLGHVPQHGFIIGVRPYVGSKAGYPRITGWDTFTNPAEREADPDSLLTTFVQQHAVKFVDAHSRTMLNQEEPREMMSTFLSAYHEMTCSASTAAAAQLRMLSARRTLLNHFVDLLRTDVHQLSTTLQEAYMTRTGELRCFVVSFVDESPGQPWAPSYTWADQ